MTDFFHLSKTQMSGQASLLITGRVTKETIAYLWKLTCVSHPILDTASTCRRSQSQCSEDAAGDVVVEPWPQPQYGDCKYSLPLLFTPLAVSSPSYPAENILPSRMFVLSKFAVTKMVNNSTIKYNRYFVVIEI